MRTRKLVLQINNVTNNHLGMGNYGNDLNRAKIYLWKHPISDPRTFFNVKTAAELINHQKCIILSDLFCQSSSLLLNLARNSVGILAKHYILARNWSIFQWESRLLMMRVMKQTSWYALLYKETNLLCGQTFHFCHFQPDSDDRQRQFYERRNVQKEESAKLDR